MKKYNFDEPEFYRIMHDGGNRNLGDSARQELKDFIQSAIDKKVCEELWKIVGVTTFRDNTYIRERLSQIENKGKEAPRWLTPTPGNGG